MERGGGEQRGQEGDGTEGLELVRAGALGRSDQTAPSQAGGWPKIGSAARRCSLESPPAWAGRGTQTA